MQDDDDKQNSKDHEEGILEIMEDNDLDVHQAHEVERLEDEGYDEEDAVSKVQNS
jgi:hypothetical protein